MLRARTLIGVPRDITVWEAHYGQRPNVGELLLGPFGCLAYLILTKETRQRKGMSTYWGERAIPGIYLGCEVNPHTMDYHHIITDGKTIFSSPNRIKPVPDVYPMRLQLNHHRTLDSYHNRKMSAIKHYCRMWLSSTVKIERMM
jgi:hypothetical protein